MIETDDQKIISDLCQISPEKKEHIAKALVKASFIFTGLIGGVPFIGRATKYARGNFFLEGLYGYSIVASLGMLTTWAFIDITRSLSHPFIKFKHSIGSVIASSIFGAFSALPITVISIVYDEPIPFILLAFMTDAIGNTFPINNGIRKIFAHIRAERTPQLQEKRRKLLDFVQSTICAINESNPKISYARLQRSGLLNLINQKPESVSLESLISILRTFVKQRHTPDNSFWYTKKIFSISMGLVVASGWLPTGFKVIYQHVRDLTKNSVFGVACGMLSTIPVYLLEFTLGEQLSHKIISNIIAKIRRNRTKSFAETNYSFAFYFMLSIGILTTLFSWAPRALVVEDYQEGLYESFALPWVIGSVIFFKSSAMLNFLLFTIQYFSKKFSDEQISATARSLDYLESLGIYLQELEDEKKLDRLNELLSVFPDFLVTEESPHHESDLLLDSDIRMFSSSDNPSTASQSGSHQASSKDFCA